MLVVARSTCDELRTLVDRWSRVVRVDLSAFNRTLASHGMTPLAGPSTNMKLCST